MYLPAQDLGGGLPFLQLSLPTSVAASPLKTGASSYYSIYRLPLTQSSGSRVFTTFNGGNTLSSYPALQALTTAPDVNNFYSYSQVPLGTTSQAFGSSSYPYYFSQGSGLLQTGVGQHYTLLTNGLSHKSNYYKIKRRR